MKEFHSFEKKVLKDQKVEKRVKKKNDDDTKMSRRSFLKLGFAAGATVATGGVARELMKIAEKDEAENKAQPKNKIGDDVTKSEEAEVEQGESSGVHEEKTEEENEKEVLSSVEKIEMGLGDVDPNETVEVKVKEKGMKGLVEKKMTLEQWAKVSGKRKKLQKVKRIYQGRIKKIAKETGLIPELIVGVITQESNGNPKALSKKAVFSKRQNKYIKVPFARGLMQITPDKKEKYKMNDIFHPYENILAGSKHLRELIDMYDDLENAISAYNLGVTGLRRRKAEGFDPREHHYVKKIKYLSSLAQDNKI
ncbi:MAG: transglycosylase SLT domain-containing protein [Patescibacteria group bacterium]|nr:transglycosylase SLT domain-containing protein [Patescibacteria group bacterium]